MIHSFFIYVFIDLASSSRVRQAETEPGYEDTALIFYTTVPTSPYGHGIDKLSLSDIQ